MLPIVSISPLIRIDKFCALATTALISAFRRQRLAFVGHDGGLLRLTRGRRRTQHLDAPLMSLRLNGMRARW
jgi:hypothetical protein